MRAALLVAFLSLLLAAPAARALDKCRVKVDKTGILKISASNVDGKLQWGWSEDAVTESLHDEQDCVARGTDNSYSSACQNDGSYYP